MASEAACITEYIMPHFAIARIIFVLHLKDRLIQIAVVIQNKDVLIRNNY